MQVGSVHLGVRYGTPETAELLERVLRRHLVEDTAVPANYSVRLASDESARASARPLNMLYRAACPVVRSTSVGTVVRALLSYLGAHREARQGRYLLVDSLAVVRDGQAIVVPTSLERTLAVSERRLADAGLRLLPGPSVALDPETGQLAPITPLDADEQILDALDPEAPAIPSDQERYPVATWVISRIPGHLDPVPPAVAIERLLAMSHNARLVGAERSLAALLGTVKGATLLAGGSLPSKEAVSWLTTLAG